VYCSSSQSVRPSVRPSLTVRPVSNNVVCRCSVTTLTSSPRRRLVIHQTGSQSTNVTQSLTCMLTFILLITLPPLPPVPSLLLVVVYNPLMSSRTTLPVPLLFIVLFCLATCLSTNEFMLLTYMHIFVFLLLLMALLV